MPPLKSTPATRCKGRGCARPPPERSPETSIALEETMHNRKISRVLLLTVALAVAAITPAAAQKPVVEVGKQPPITILVASTPWYPAFEKVVGLYEQQTGNQIKLDTTPFGGMLEKARNAVRTGKSPYDLMMLDTQWTIEFY